MHRDDISALYLHLGLPSQHYQDFQTEEDFRERIGRAVAKWATSLSATVRTAGRSKGPIIAVVSVGDFQSGKFISGLAGLAAQRRQAQGIVQVVDLIPGDDALGRYQPQVNGVRSVLIDSIEQSARVAALEDSGWLERQLDSVCDDGLVFLDVPGRALHVRLQALSVADLVLVLLPATSAAGRVVEDIEGSLNEAGMSGARREVSYLLVKAEDGKGFSPKLCEELLASRELFAPVIFNEESMQTWSGEVSSAPSSLVDICDHILGRLSA